MTNAETRPLRDAIAHARWRAFGFAAVLFVATGGLPALAASPNLISARSPLASQPVGGNGDSVSPVVTPDGRFVLFTSAANNLTPGDNSFLRSDVFLRDRLSNTTTLVSVNYSGTGGGNGNSSSGLVSTNGRYVVFESDATDLVVGDTNNATDVFLRDLQAGTTSLVSVSTAATQGNVTSAYPVMTPDGRFVAFLSFASNLVPNDTNGLQDVFVRDTVAGTTTQVSVGATGPIAAGLTNMDTPVITPDGRYVAFFSTASNLVSFSTQVNGEIYLRDLLAGTTTDVSTNIFFSNNTNQGYSSFLATASSTHPAISDDGRYLAFKHAFSTAPAYYYVCRYDATLQTDVVVSKSGYVPPPYTDDTYGPEITPDGRFVAYVATDSNLHLWDGQTATDTTISVDRLGNVPTSGLSRSPVFTPDGHFISFVSTATNLVANIISTGSHVYFRDLQAGVTSLVDVDTNGAGSVDTSGAYPGLSTNGQFVTFASPDGIIMGAGTNLALDVFVRDMTNGVTQMISAHDTGITPQSGNGISSMSQASITPDGRWLVFASHSSDLVMNDFNGGQDVFVTDLQTGSNILVSAGLDGNSALGGDSGNPVISADGRHVMFGSLATNLVTGVTKPAVNIFLRDLQAGATTVVDVDTNGNLLGNGSFTVPAMSQDARYVAFASSNHIFWRDTMSNLTVLVGPSAVPNPSMSVDGRRVAYNDNSLHFYVWDSLLASVVYSNNSVFFSALSPTGTKLAYVTNISSQSGMIIVRDLDASSNLVAFASSANLPGRAAWSADERFLAFGLTYPTNGPVFSPNQMLFCDLQAGTVTLVSANYSHTAGANNFSDSPVVSADGRFVAYRSFATDIVPGITNSPNLFVFDCLTGSNTLLTAQQPGTAGWSSWVSQPAISTNGGTIAFQSYAPGLATDTFDLNFVQDVFAVPQSPWPTTDSVGDGIPDAWRAQYFGGNGTTTNAESCAACDADNNGMSNLQKYLTGTNPTNAASVFRLQITAQTLANSFLLNWPEVPGRSYQLQYKTNLTDAVWQMAPPVWVTGNVGSFTAANSPLGGYYRVVVVN